MIKIAIITSSTYMQIKLRITQRTKCKKIANIDNDVNYTLYEFSHYRCTNDL